MSLNFGPLPSKLKKKKKHTIGPKSFSRSLQGPIHTPRPNSHSKAQFIFQGPIHTPGPNSYSRVQFILKCPIHTPGPNSYSRSPQGPIPQKTSHNFPKFRKEGSHVKTRSLFRSIFEEKKKGSFINNRPLRSLFHHFV